MKEKIIAKNTRHLKEVIVKEINFNGIFCDLNHIDVSKIIDMSHLFSELDFDGDISKWNVSNVVDMSFMFKGCCFNSDISKWNVSKVKSMSHMFWLSYFNQDISNWDVSNVRNMNSMFYESQFDRDISNWDVSKVTNMTEIFYDAKFSKDLSNWKTYSLEEDWSAFMYSKAKEPYWIGCSDKEARKESIDKYHAFLELQKELSSSNKIEKRIKI
jgi:surface protein